MARLATAATLALCLALAGCAGHWGPGVPVSPPRGAILGPRGDAPSCVRWSSGKDGPYRLPLAGAEPDAELASALAPIPAEARRVVLAAGLEPQLARLLHDRHRLTAAELLSRRQAIELHLQSLRIQLDATVYETDCSGDLLEHVQSSLDRDEASRSIRWTVLSIVTQAAAAIAIGTLELQDANPQATAVVGITGGVAASAFGAAAFVTPSREVILPHAHNLLAPIATGADPDHLYPSFVFRLLTLPRPTAPAPAEQLRTRFEELLREAVDAEELPRARALLFAEGGTYDARLVAVRERMLDELETTLSALFRDLELLQRYLQRTLATPVIGPTD